MGCGASDISGMECEYELQTCTGHEAGINCMAISDDDSLLVTGSEDKTARLWTTKTKKCECIGVLRGHEGYITCVAMSENFVITGASDRTARIWDISTCECVRVCEGHGGMINSLLTFGNFVFSSSYDRTARCWELDTGDYLREFKGHTHAVIPMLFIEKKTDPPPKEKSPTPPPVIEEESGKKKKKKKRKAEDPDAIVEDPPPEEKKEEEVDEYAIFYDHVVITGSTDNTIRLYNMHKKKAQRVYEGHEGPVLCMATDDKETQLYSGSQDGKIIKWDIARQEILKKIDAHLSAVLTITMVKSFMYTGGADHTARSWVADFGDLHRVYRGHNHTVGVVKWHNGLIITGSGDSAARVYLSKSGELKRTLTGHHYGVTCLEVVDEKVFTGSYDGTIKVFDCAGIQDDTQKKREEMRKLKEKMARTEVSVQSKVRDENANSEASPYDDESALGIVYESETQTKTGADGTINGVMVNGLAVPDGAKKKKKKKKNAVAP